jgi:hypothetical protein
MSKQILTTSVVYFTSIVDDPYFTANAHTFQSASIVTTTTTSDANVSVVAVENLTQYSDGVDPSCVFTITITTTDKDITIGSTPTITDPSISVNITADESTDANGNFVTVATIVVTKPGTEHVFGQTKNDETDTLQEPNYRYLILRHNLIDGYLHGNPGGDYNMTCQEMYSLLNFTCVKLSEGLYQTLKQTWGKEEIIELDADTAYYGTTFFSEIRPVAKLWEAKTSWYGEKIPTQITPEIVTKILTVMKAFATEAIECEYERRYLAMRGASDFEADTWTIQRTEAEDYTANSNAPTPFLDTLATRRGIDKSVLIASVLENAQSYESQLANMLVDMQILIKRFQDCTTVKDINILYEDYFGIAMPIKQAIDLGRTISADNWNRKPEWSVKGNGYYF